MLYFFDIKGKVSSEVEYFFELPNGWPKTEQEAETLVSNYLAGDKFVELPQDYYLWEGKHDWYGHEREVLLKPTDKENVAEIHVMEHDFLMQLLVVHKGFAGTFF